jgi:hypothetical protein
LAAVAAGKELLRQPTLLWPLRAVVVSVEVVVVYRRKVWPLFVLLWRLQVARLGEAAALTNRAAVAQ